MYLRQSPQQLRAMRSEPPAIPIYRSPLRTPPKQPELILDAMSPTSEKNPSMMVFRSSSLCTTPTTNHHRSPQMNTSSGSKNPQIEDSNTSLSLHQARGGTVSLLRALETGNSPIKHRANSPSAAFGNSPYRVGTAEVLLRRTSSTVGGVSLSNAHHMNESFDTATMGGLVREHTLYLLPQLKHHRGNSWITVVFDLDETLCNNRRQGRALLRPGSIELLKSLAAMRADNRCYVEIVLWTASMECVARPVVLRLDPDGTIFNHLIFRDRRWYKETGYTKDLRLLGRDMSHVVIIENSPASVILNRKHALLVKDFLGVSLQNDQALPVVQDVLLGWAKSVGDSICPDEPVPDETNKKPLHDTTFTSTTTTALPRALGVVEYLAAHSSVNQRNEIIVPSSFRCAFDGQLVVSRSSSTTALALMSPLNAIGPAALLMRNRLAKLGR